MHDYMGCCLLIGIYRTCFDVCSIVLQFQWGFLFVVNLHWLKVYHIQWKDDLRGQFLMLEGCKYFFQAVVKNLVTILYQIYCYVHQHFQMENIWVSWCVGTAIWTVTQYCKHQNMSCISQSTNNIPYYRAFPSITRTNVWILETGIKQPTTY